MAYIEFDHHRKWTQAAAIDDQGKIIREILLLNDRNSLKGFLKGLVKPLKGVVEAGPVWDWTPITSCPPYFSWLLFPRTI